MEGMIARWKSAALPPIRHFYASITKSTEYVTLASIGKTALNQKMFFSN
jgi:hypothetical protein